MRECNKIDKAGIDCDINERGWCSTHKHPVVHEQVVRSTKVLVCGSRELLDQKLVYNTLDKELAGLEDVEIIEGGARGADALTWLYCYELGIKCITVEAEWDKYGKRAGILRNIKMIEKKPELVIAFPGGIGTNNMKEIAETYKVEIVNVK